MELKKLEKLKPYVLWINFYLNAPTKRLMALTSLTSLTSLFKILLYEKNM